MKLRFSTNMCCLGSQLLLLIMTGHHVTNSFTLVPTTCQQPKTTTSSSASSMMIMKASRRDILDRLTSTTTGVVAALLGATTTITTAQPCYADVDFNKVQDLLGNTDQQQPKEYVPGGKRPMYLTEPTAEFKYNEEKSAEFKRKNLLLKKTFQEALEKITTDPNDGNILAKSIDNVRYLVKSNGGLPEGITKDEVVKICRRRKSKKFWPTDVEIAYQDLLMEIAIQQSPNTDRDKTFI